MTSDLMLVNVENPFQGEFLEVESIAFVKVRADSLGVMIHNNLQQNKYI